VALDSLVVGECLVLQSAPVAAADLRKAVPRSWRQTTDRAGQLAIYGEQWGSNGRDVEAQIVNGRVEA